MISEDFSSSLPMGSRAPYFDLLATDGRRVSPETFGSASLLVLQFTCNHCPYVLGSDERLSRLVDAFKSESIAWVGICSNDAGNYPQDSYERMQERAGRLPYLYLHDPTQSAAKAYGAQVTPEIFVFTRGEGDWSLAWHGGIDDSPRNAAQRTEDYLAPALKQLLAGEPAEPATRPVQGCSIKWL
ncbi:MAG: thioredoxin family protein [Myxococcota bacterium]|nr:thioredoxin family protein [Myxococcota bacterium]